MAEKQIAVDLIINKAEAAKSMGDVKAALKEIKSAMLEMGDEGGKDFNKLATAASNLKEKVKDTDEQIANMKNGGLGSINTIAQGTGVAIQGMTSAMALFGDESEDVQKTMMKVQAAMAFGQAIAGIEEMGKAFGALFTLIEANPIGALITLVAGLAVGIYEYSKAQKDANSELAKATAAYELQKQTTAALNSEYDREISKLQAQGASEKDIIDIKKKKIDAQIAELKAGEAVHIAAIRDIKDNDDFVESESRVIESIYQKLGATDKAAQAEDTIKKLKALRAKDDVQAVTDAEDQIKTLQQDRENLDIAYTTHQIERTKEVATTEVQIAKDKFDQIAVLEHQAQVQSADMYVQTLDDMSAVTYSKLDDFFLVMEERFRAFTKTNQNLNSMNSKFATDQLSSIMGSFSDISKKHAKLSKAFAIAQAVINTYQGATKALATLPPPASFITAGATLAAGLANVLKIKNTDETGSSSPSVSTGGGTFAISSTMGGNALGQPETLLNPNGTAQNQNQPQRVYVVESDITRSQRRVSTIESQNLFH